MSYTDFQIGEKFPLPIRQQGEGGLFQVDANGAMFILQLAKSDIIAIEAFRTGEMELALYETEGVLFLLYRIPGIFKDGWGDAPLSFGGLSKGHLPSEESLARASLHLCLVDARLSLLLAQREAQMPAPFADFLRRHTLSALKAPLAPQDFAVRVQSIWKRMSPAEMREKAAVVWEIPLALKGAPLH
ncbi:hypothetical protein [uncultured Selenomonas sp.]|uniref:hypothetical protein n=1 Tax=uncultured Selenomonas sp. TaxID=159275 RepID=UPI0028D5582E|nr:hypothetical protein [uncultured Selenomonas sp.]